MPENLICRPEFELWPDLFRQDLPGQINKVTSFFDHQIPAELLNNIRQELIESSVNYCKLFGITKNAPNKKVPILAFGHQPVVYHPGLLAKHTQVLNFAREHKVQSIEIIIDTDVGQAIKLLYPVKLPDAGWQLANIEISTGPGPYLFHKIKISKNYELKNCEPEHKEKLEDFLSILQKHAGQDLSAVMSKVRHQDIGDLQTLVLPLSHLLALPSIKKLTCLILSSPEKLNQVYNQTLDVFRVENKIKNAANPFPNMGQAEELLEMPIWVINTQMQTRQALFWNKIKKCFVSTTSTKEVQACDINLASLAPRGMLTTFLLRLFCSDVFVHGLGGEKYDPATDQFIRNVSAQEPPAYTVVSATRYLLVDQVSTMRELESLAERKRELYNHPQLAIPIIKDNNQKLAIEELVEQAVQIRANLLEEKAKGASVKPIQEQLSAVNLAIRSMLDKALFLEASEKLNYLQGQRSAIMCREYPWFLYD